MDLFRRDYVRQYAVEWATKRNSSFPGLIRLNGLNEIISQYGPSREFGARIKDTLFKHVIWLQSS